MKIDRSYWLYGSIIGILLVILEIIHYKAMVRELRIEVFGIIIGVLFLLFGTWIGVHFFSKKKQGEKYDAVKLGLSKREMEVLQLIADGHSNQEIADLLFVSLNTAKTHISHIYAKLGVSRRTQAVQKAQAMTLSTSSQSR